MTRTTTLGVLVVVLMMVTGGAAGFAGAMTSTSSDAGDATAAASPAPLAQDTTEENETANETTTAEMGNESETEEPEVDPNASASVTFDDQPSNGSALVVNETNLSDGGFVVILDDGGRMLGNSTYLEPGVHENVTVELNTTLNESGVVLAVPQQDTNDNETFDYNATLAADIGEENATDGPYLENGAPGGSTAYVTIGNDTSTRSLAAPKADSSCW